jgi:PAS domain S-box-containing protein
MKVGMASTKDERSRQELLAEIDALKVALKDNSVARLEAEKALRENESLFVDIASAGADWFWRTDVEHRFIEFSIGDWVEPGFWGDLARGGSRQDFAAPEDIADDPEKWRRHRQDLDAHRPFRDFEYFVDIPGEGRTWLRASGVPKIGDNGRFQGYAGTTSIVTAEVSAEAKARRKERRLLGALEHLSGRFALFDAEDLLLYANRAWYDFHGVTESPTSTGIRYEEALRSLVSASKIEVPTGGEEAWIEARLRSRSIPGKVFENTDSDGRVHSVHDHRLPDGGIISITADVTEIRRAETEKITVERRLAGIVQVAIEAIVSMDNERKILTFNPAAEQIFGYRQQEVIGQPIEILVPLAYRDGHPALVKEFEGAKGTNRMMGARGEISGARKDGSVFPARAAISKFATGGETFFNVHLEDITEEKRAETENERLLSQLAQAQKMETIGTLAGGIAHDFNNLLAPILGHAEMAMDGLSGDDPALRHLEPILSGSMRAAELVKQILTFSRHGKGHRQKISVHETVQEILGLLRAATPATVEIVEEISEDCQPIYANPTEVHQLVMNLCTNGIQAMSGESGKLVVGLEVFNVDTGFAAAHPGLGIGPHVKVSVADDGSGMSNATREKIFEPFFTTKDAGKGTGLGLSVAHGIAASLDGNISVYSELGTGTRFDVYLPCVDVEAHDDWRPKSEAHGGTERILIVDDEVSVVSMASEMLAPMGYDVTSFSSAVAALEAFSSNPGRFDLVVTDQTMPEMTGYDLAGRILAIRPATPIVIMTGFSANVTVEMSQRLGIKEFLMKPFTRDLLDGAIRRALDK